MFIVSIYLYLRFDLFGYDSNALLVFRPILLRVFHITACQVGYINLTPTSALSSLQHQHCGRNST